MKTGRDYKFWFCTGSQDLYGDECLRKVAEHSKIIVEELNKSGVLPFCDFIYRIGINFPAKFDLCFYLIPLCNGNISHIVSHTANTDDAHFFPGKILDPWP